MKSLFSVSALVIMMQLCISEAISQGFDNAFWLDEVHANEHPVFRSPFMAVVPEGLSYSPVTSGLYVNTNRAWGPGSGAVWQGKGVTFGGSFGFRHRSRFLDLQLETVYLYAGNASFRNENAVGEVPGSEFFDFYYQRINYRERIGPRVIHDLFLGNSWIRLNAGPVTAGISNENVIWGPGRRHALLMNNNAPGFEHLTLHTNRPLNIYIGRLQTQMMVGRLASSYFEDGHLPEGRVHISGLNIGLSPWFSDHLHLGLIRTFTVNEGSLHDLGDYVPFFQSFLKYRFQNEDNVRGNDSYDQRASAYFNWYFPASKLAFYGEYARDDHSADLRDLFLEPSHTRAFLLGLEKQFSGLYSHSDWLLNAELVHTEYTNTSYVRQAGLISFYTHETVRQGYSHVGQLLGSYFGAGGNGWFISARNSREWGGFGLLFERVSRNKDLYQRILSVNDEARPELELVFGLSGTYYLDVPHSGRVKLFGVIHAVQYRNKFYLPNRQSSDGELNYYHPLNLNMQFVIRYEMRNR